MRRKSEPCPGVSYTTGYGYDAFGRLNQITYPSGRTVNYSFDALGRISQIDTTVGGATQMVAGSVTYAQSLSGAPGSGGVKSFVFGNAASYSRTYDLDGRISAYTLGSLSRTLTYDAELAHHRVHPQQSVYNQSFGYDNINRLTRWLGPSSSQAYQLRSRRQPNQQHDWRQHQCIHLRYWQQPVDLDHRTHRTYLYL